MQYDFRLPLSLPGIPKTGRRVKVGVQKVANLFGKKKQILRKLVKGIRLSPGETQAQIELFDWPKVNAILSKTSTVHVALQRA